MFKKILKFMKFIIVGIVWSYVFIYASVLLTIKLWNFNYLSVSDWGIIDTYWEQGGALRQPKDYGFFFTLLALIPVWLLGWRYLYKKSFTAFLMAPIVWYNKKMIARYGSESSRIILKNLGSTTQKIDPKEIIESKLKRVKTNMEHHEKTSDFLREQLKEKINSDELK